MCTSRGPKRKFWFNASAEKFWNDQTPVHPTFDEVVDEPSWKSPLEEFRSPEVPHERKRICSVRHNLVQSVYHFGQCSLRDFRHD